MIPAKLGTALTLAALALFASPMSAAPVIDDAPAATDDQATVQIDMFEFAYVDENGLPVTLISSGDSVRFVNTGALPHTGTDSLGTWDTGTVNSGGARTLSFPGPGTYAYECTFHPSMRGVLVVS